MSKMRIGFVGPYTYFENHFPENWRGRDDVLCLDVDEWDYSFLTRMINFRPDLTVFYRPELYPKKYIKSITGKRVAFLSEPIQLPGQLETPESALRSSVYSRMSWESYHYCIYYDATKKSAIEKRGWPINAYRPLPIDTSAFRPNAGRRPIDVAFIGKPTPHRVAELDFLRSTDLKFAWVAHGLSGRALAALFRRSKVVLNIHADEMPSFEPRIYLGAACGCVVLSETLGQRPEAMKESIVEYTGSLDYASVKRALRLFSSGGSQKASELESLSLGVGRFLQELEMAISV
ncbi:MULTISPECIES: hypothetical protein [unclassified Mesorhizobium]|uniref:hypothetical protein n=1 Tax=unclassified Mesorhizobium TaxID=325217 RepID=UPI000FCA02C1|nr:MULTISPECIES: hypothetical protein [unclassified Mesorhizobium]RUY86676.1 hypothetical protein EN974_33520 [Mesorhizobium sp. M7A.F.Ca.CA.001.12.2.1]RUZ47410.1 hypothetical protein EN948_12135 [Mesorhizobium sp. M7A.F.Ca.US.003.02.1.1]RUZ69495.1 hypothetical protein EN950_04240 [Mesorhizobium sp. M7A.F.Ca.US.007.01.1.1]